MTQRVRCICGKVYDTAETGQCPSCGAPAAQSVTAPDEATSENGGASPAPRSGSSSLIYVAAHVATLALAAVAAAKFIVPDTIPIRPIIVVNDDPHKNDPKPGPDPHKDNNPHLRESPFKQDPKPQPKPEPKPQTITKHDWIVDAKGAEDSDGVDAADVLGKAADNDTITLRPGIYPTSLTFTKPVHLVGDTKGQGHVLIKSPGMNKECVVIRAKGVTLENIEFLVDTSGATAAVSAMEGSGVQLVNCTIQSRSSVGLAATGNAAVVASKSTFFNIEGSSVDLNQQAQAQLTDCSFTHDFSGVMVVDGARATLKGCKFLDMGQPKGGGSELYARGATASISAEHCEFSKCRGSMLSLQKANVTFEDCTLADNGAVEDTNAWTNGLFKVYQGGHMKAVSTTFRSNRYGLLAMMAGTMDLQDCHFAGNGTKSTAPALDFYTDNLSVTGAGSSVTLKHCDFAGAVRDAINVTQGGSITLTNTDISTSAGTGLGIGVGPTPPTDSTEAPGPASATPAHAEISLGHFTGNQSGIVAGGGCSLTMNGTILQRHDTALVVQDADSQAQLDGVTMSDSRELGMECSGGAEVTAKNCTFQGNAGGAIVGVPHAASPKSVLTLELCKLIGNTGYDATVCPECKLVLHDCSFGEDGGGKPKVIREKGGEIQSHPPVDSLADNGPSDNGSGTKDTPKKQSTAPTKKRSRSSNPNSVNGLINRLRKNFLSQ